MRNLEAHQAALVVTGFPSASLLCIGYEWERMTDALRLTSIMAMIIFSIGIYFYFLLKD